MGNREPSWYTEKHRRLAEAEKARQRWMMESSQWPYERNGDRIGPLPGSPWPKLIIATLILVFLMELMLQRSMVDSPVTDEMIGMPDSSR